MMQTYFSPCPRGLEELLSQEVKEQGAQRVEVVPGGVSYQGDWAVCHRVNLHSFLATRVLCQLTEGFYRKEQHIYELANAVSWLDFFDANLSIRVYVTAIKSPLKSLNFITLKIKDAVCDHFMEKVGRRPNVDTENPDIRIHAFLTEKNMILYIDSSGEPLWKRGFKPAKFNATLKENLAAGIIKLSGWRPGEAFYDPMCGSGTFLLEAAHMTLGVAPGLGRSFSFEKWKNFSAESWDKIKTAAISQKKQLETLPIFGSDIHQKQVDIAYENLAHAGLQELVSVKKLDFLKSKAPADSGVLICNPPYGKRIGDEDQLADWYPLLGDTLKKQYAGWNCYFFTGDLSLAKHIRLQASKRTPLMNGKIDCRLFEYKMKAGGNRKEDRSAEK